MRVVSGTRKGHKLKVSKGLDVRPTEDRIKESLFNILGTINSDSMVLDAFGGSGSIGIEFLSRGAKHCVFIDNNKKSIEIIKENLNHTRFLEKSTVYHGDVFRLLGFLRKKNFLFDYIYIDPPFGEGLTHKMLHYINKEDILKEQGRVIVEHESKLILEDSLLNFSTVDKREYGSKTITFYKKKI
ncbi:MAG: 16S rRNA (guanine(966)-N(2))-methyltransferase RsmD [Tissierellaceae bacterium]|nr:16S rRNA (guanine(966)-N(2))-methyltransferase RsmD [Tissierellaceae bacterium]